MSDSPNNENKSNINNEPPKDRVKITPADLKTPTGSRQDILDEYTRLIHEIESNKEVESQKFKEFIKKKDIQFRKGFEPNTEADTDSEMPIDGDTLQGSRVFMKSCASCHTLEGTNEGRRSVGGPPLGLIYGKRAGGDKFFQYSDSYIHSTMPWTQRNLYRYLKDPQKMFPGTKCSIKGGGLYDESERADITKFLRLFSKNLKTFLENKTKRAFGTEYIDTMSRAQSKANETTYTNITKQKD